MGIHCQVNSWSAWSKCTKSCAGGKTSRSRSVVMQAFYAGRVCPSLAETVSCNSHKCPVDCVMTQFSAWTKCSKTCGTGQQSRSRQITTSAAFGGINCPSAQAVRKCSVQDCAVDCTVSAYGAYSPCSKSCGGGLKFKNRSVLRASAYGGKTCPTLRETAPSVNTVPGLPAPRLAAAAVSSVEDLFSPLPVLAASHAPSFSSPVLATSRLAPASVTTSTT